MITRSSSLLALLADAQAAGAVVLLSAPLLNSLSCSATDPFDGLVVVEAPCARGLKAPDRADAKTCGAVQPHPICRTLSSEGPANRCNAAAQCARGPEAPPFDDDLPAPWQSHVSKRTGKQYWYNPDTKETTWLHPITGKTVRARQSVVSDRKCSFAETIQTLKADADAQEPVVELFCCVIDRTVACARGPAAPQSVVSDRKGSLASFAETIQTLKADADAQEPVVELFCRVIDRTVAYNDARIASKQHKPMHDFHAMHPLFEGTKIPLSPSEYVKRILKYTRCSPCNIIVGLVYLQRVKELDVNGKCWTRLTSYNIQRLLLTALLLASKFLDEPHASNRQWALVGDLSVQEMNSMELEMLWLLKFSLNISRDEYDESLRQLETLSNSFN